MCIYQKIPERYSFINSSCGAGNFKKEMETMEDALIHEIPTILKKEVKPAVEEKKYIAIEGQSHQFL